MVNEREVFPRPAARKTRSDMRKEKEYEYSIILD